MKFSRYIIPSYLTLVLSTALNVSADEGKLSYEKTDAHGTKVEVEHDSKREVDSDGDVEIKSNTTRVTDPKGLMNKTKESNDTKAAVDADGEKDIEKKSVDAAGTLRKGNTEVDVDKHLDGGHTTTTEKTEVVDPKGLMNKETVKVTKEVRKNAAGQVTGTNVEKEVNGDEVSNHKEGSH